MRKGPGVSVHYGHPAVSRATPSRPPVLVCRPRSRPFLTSCSAAFACRPRTRPSLTPCLAALVCRPHAGPSLMPCPATLVCRPHARPSLTPLPHTRPSLFAGHMQAHPSCHAPMAGCPRLQATHPPIPHATPTCPVAFVCMPATRPPIRHPAAFACRSRARPPLTPVFTTCLEIIFSVTTDSHGRDTHVPPQTSKLVERHFGLSMSFFIAFRRRLKVKSDHPHRIWIRLAEDRPQARDMLCGLWGNLFAEYFDIASNPIDADPVYFVESAEPNLCLVTEVKAQLCWSDGRSIWSMWLPNISRSAKFKGVCRCVIIPNGPSP